jgi:hypothetical protein
MGEDRQRKFFSRSISKHQAAEQERIEDDLATDAWNGYKPDLEKININQSRRIMHPSRSHIGQPWMS